MLLLEASHNAEQTNCRAPRFRQLLRAGCVERRADLLGDQRWARNRQPEFRCRSLLMHRQIGPEPDQGFTGARHHLACPLGSSPHHRASTMSFMLTRGSEPLVLNQEEGSDIRTTCCISISRNDITPRRGASLFVKTKP